MTLGTSIGGYKIIKTVGLKMTKLEPYQGTAADISSATALLVSSIFGMPVSTTHTKTTSIMGVGASKRVSNVNWGVVKNMSLAWILTFPGCGLLGYFATLVFMSIGCSNKESNSVNEVKENPSETIAKKIPEEVCPHIT